MKFYWRHFLWLDTTSRNEPLRAGIWFPSDRTLIGSGRLFSLEWTALSRYFRFGPADRRCRVPGWVIWAFGLVLKVYVQRNADGSHV